MKQLDTNKWPVVNSRNSVAAIDYVTMFNGRALLYALGYSGVAFSFFLIFSILLAWAGSSTTLCLLLTHVGAATSLYVYWRLGRWGAAKFDCFGAALLFSSLAFRILAIVDLLLFGTRVQAIPPTVPIGDLAIYWLLKGETLTDIGVLLIVSSWRLSIGRQIEKFSFIRNYRDISIRVAWLTYVLALFIDLARITLGIKFGALDQLSGLTFSFGVASIMFIAIRTENVGIRVSKALMLALPMVFLALGGGMKEQIFFPMVPAALLYWLGYRSLGSRALAIVCGFFILAVSQMYIEYVRVETWQAERHESTMDLLTGFQKHLETSSLVAGLDDISSRINMTTAHAITVSLADVYGNEPLNVFGDIPASFIPRLFWPGKPIMQPGAMQTARIYGLHGSISEIRSATAAGFSTELYLGGSYFGWFFGAIIFGWLMAKAQKITYRYAFGFGHLGLSFVSVYWALRFDETAVVYAYTSIVFSMVYVLFISRAIRLFGLDKPD